MTKLDDRAQVPTAPRQLVLLMTVVMAVNYIDRGNLATAGPLLIDELKLTATEFGSLLTAFYMVYTLAMVPAGWLAERYGVKRALGVGVAIWSAATLLTGFASGFIALFALRCLLGVGESVVFPGTSKVVRSSVAPARMGVANGMLAFGYQFGPALGILIGGPLMHRIGWRAVFMLFGALSLLWLVPWRHVRLRELTTQPGEGSADAPPFATILRQRALWGTAIGLFGVNYSFYFVLTWLPTYLVKARGFSMDEMTAIATPAYALCAAAAVLGGLIMDRSLRAGRSHDFALKGLMSLSYLVGLCTMIGMVLLPPVASIGCLFVYEFFGGLASPTIYAASQVFAGPGASARWVGVQNACGNVAGILAPLVTGVLVDASGSYVSAFVVAALANIVGFIGWMWVMPTITPIRWPGPAVRDRAVSFG
jgi:MFS family permease